MPDVVYHALAYTPYANWNPPSNRLSVSELLDSPQLVWLRRKYKDQIVSDCADNLFALLGHAGHEVFGNAKKAFPERYELERKIRVTFGDWLITGRLDAIDLEEQSISDFKFTSVFSFLMGDKPEWIGQLNIYAYLLRTVGWIDDNKQTHKFNAKYARIIAVLRDWVSSKATFEKDYPKRPFHVVPIKLYSDKAMTDWLSARLMQHETVRDSIDLPYDEGYKGYCDAQQRWAKPTTYAVKVSGVKKAKRVLNSKDEAEQWIVDQAKKNTKGIATAYIEERQGENVRCERFCPVKDWCPQYNKHYRKDPKPSPDAGGQWFQT